MKALKQNASEGVGEKVTRVRKLWSSFGWIILLFACWLAGTIMDLFKYLPHKEPVFIVVGLFCITAVIACLRWVLKERTGKQPGWGRFAALWAFVAVLYMIVFPMSLEKPDRNDSYSALYRASLQLLHGHFPYYVQAYSGGLITHMPGALFLALPFQ